jgi:hypothetical protein
MKSVAVEAEQSQVSPLGALKNIAPSVFSLSSSPIVSENYRHITTSDVVQHLMLQGWQLDKAGESRVTKAKREAGLAPYVAHAVTLRHPDFQVGQRLKMGQIVPNIMIGGSHNRTTAFWMNGGLYRCICDNQAVVGMNTFEARFKHQGNFTRLMDAVYRSVEQIVSKANVLTEVVDRWSSITLSTEQRHELYRRVIMLRPESTGRALALSNLDVFDERRRPQDGGNDLFTTFQVMQEHTMRGHRGFVNMPNGGGANRTISRGVGGVNAFVDVNRSMWALTETYANELSNA